MNSRLRPDHGPEIRLADADALPLVTSDEAVLQAVAARFARSRLSAEQLRDVKLLVFVMEMEGGRLGAEGPGGLGRQAPLPGIADWGEQLAAAAGISRARIEAAAARLVDAGVLVPDPATPGRLGFAADVLRPIGVAQFLDWPWVTSRLRGHVPALLIFRAFLDTVRDPGGWTSATYESLARHACYSLGMAQRGVAQLLAAGVLERSTHVGRGHDYQLSARALGRRPLPGETPEPAPSERGELGAPPSPLAALPTPPAPDARAVAPALASAGATLSSMVVEIGGLVLRVPDGTEIRMGVQPDGVPFYQVGPDLKISRRPS